MNKMKIFNLVYKIKNCEKTCGGSSLNGMYFNKIYIFLTFTKLQICKDPHQSYQNQFYIPWYTFIFRTQRHFGKIAHKHFL